ESVHGLSLAVPEPTKELIKPWSDRKNTGNFADSGVDDQMIIHFPSAENVRLRIILLKLVAQLRSCECAPLIPEYIQEEVTLRFNIYRDIDFAEANSMNTQFNISLLEGNTGNAGDARLIDRLTEKSAGQQTTAW
ncbi:hypothetical protein AN958_12355, partial [Leucoagaricus sp. SymC.cos]